MRRRSWCYVFILVFLFCSCRSQSFSPPPSFESDGSTVLEQSFKPRHAPKDALGIEYALLFFRPKNTGEKFSLLVVLHGAGQTGASYLKIWEAEARRRRIMILAPTWQANAKHEKYDLIEFSRLVDDVARRYPVDQNRIFLSGVSAGGIFARELFQENPSKWKSLVFIAYANGNDWAQSLPNQGRCRILFVHGAKDQEFRSETVNQEVNYLKRDGVKVEWMEYPDARHEHRQEWDKAIFDWLKEA